MQLIDFALIGLAVAAPSAQVAPIKEATTCPALNGAQVLSNNQQAYKLECGKWVDAGGPLRITTTEIGYKGCLTACDGTIDCALSQFVATDDKQMKGSCTLFKAGVPVKEGKSNSWTLATKIPPTTCPGLNNAQVTSNNQQPYKLECGKWVDAAGPPLRITTTEIGYKGCLTACDGTIDCGLSEFVATDDKQMKGSCTLFKAGAPVKQGKSSSWTLATKLPKPAPKPRDPPLDKFGLRAVLSGSPIHNVAITASRGKLRVGGHQDATCDKKWETALFYLKNGEAFLYGKAGTPQQLWVDRSYMGAGASGYTTGARQPPKGGERKTFSVDANGNFVFEGKSPFACPSADPNAGWSLWFTSSPTPAGQQGCKSITLKVMRADQPASCLYTSSA